MRGMGGVGRKILEERKGFLVGGDLEFGVINRNV